MRFTNKHNLPQGIFEALTADNYDGVKDDPKVISVSGLINPPRVRQLWQKHESEIEQDAMDMVWSMFGRAVHEVCDNISSTGRIKEERLELEVETAAGSMKLTGKPDIFNISSGIIEDYKITSAWSLVFAGESGKEEWEKQLNCYAYLLRKKGYQVNGLRIIAILRDWTNSKATEDESYPQSQIQIVNIKDWGIAEQERYIRERIELHVSANGRAEADLPVCTEGERWARPTTYAVYVKGGKKATKVFEDKAQAEAFIKFSNDPRLELVTRHGKSTRCLAYCPVNKFCSFYRSIQQNMGE